MHCLTLVGIISNSLAIASDAIHSLIDSISGLIIIVSEKLATNHKFTKYRQKIERVTTVIIAIIIIAIGIEIIVASLKNIITPEEVEYSIPTIIVLIASIIAKCLLALYLKTTGKTVKSNVLAASGTETLNDAWISVAVLVSAIIYLIWGINIESYVSIIIAIIILKVGLEFIFPRISKHHHHHLENNPNH